MSAAVIPQSSPPRSTVLVTEGLLLVMALIWGFNFAVLKYGTQVLEPLAYNGARMIVGALVMTAVVMSQRDRLPSLRDIGALMLLGILGHGVYQAFFIQGLARTRAGTASLVIAASPAVIAIVGRIFGGEPITKRQVMGILASISGVLLVIVGSANSSEGEASVIGDMLILVSVVAWAFYTTWLRPMTHRIDGVQIAAWTLVGGTIPMALYAAPAMLRAEWGAVTPLTIGAILYSGLMALGVAYLFWYRGVRVIGPTRTAMYSNLQPIVAVAVSWPLLGEVPTLFQGVGAIGVVVGVLLTRSDSEAPEPAHGE
jgi:drug/metabolite transporter (DMT)-like permease